MSKTWRHFTIAVAFAASCLIGNMAVAQIQEPFDLGRTDPGIAVRQIVGALRRGNLDPVKLWFSTELLARIAGNLDLFQAAVGEFGAIEECDRA